ncbi:unnamed protein product [Prunus brigantina]
MAATSLVLDRTEAAEYVVGDDLGWTIPPDGAPTYASWASKHTLVVGDILVFKFEAGEQDLAFVTKEDLGSCVTLQIPCMYSRNQQQLNFLEPIRFMSPPLWQGTAPKGKR